MTAKPPRKKYRFKTREDAEQQVMLQERRARWLLWLYAATMRKTLIVLAKSGPFRLMYLQSPSGFSDCYVYEFESEPDNSRGMPHLVFYESYTEAYRELSDWARNTSDENPDRKHTEALIAGLVKHAG